MTAEQNSIEKAPRLRKSRRKTRPDELEQLSTQQTWRSLFLDYIGHMTISSKELDADQPAKLGDVLYGAQYRFLDEICEGLDRGVHHFVCLKARQLGISTISLAMDVFWLSVHDRMQGAIITDTEGNRDKFRILLEQYIESLPRGLRVGIRTHNRNNLVLNNGSVLDYLVAGTRKVNSSLGRSRALNFVHATEMSSWGSEEAISSMTASLAQKHPHRLYLFESTAKGFNLFHDMWEEAQKDPTQKAFFIGWWAKSDYSFKRGSEEYQRYWSGAFDEYELEVIAKVKSQYGVDITDEQIAWHRWYRTHKITDDDLMLQEFPSTEDEAFIMSGRSFFPVQRVMADKKFLEEMDGAPVKAYNYSLGENFLATELESQPVAKNADLRIWEEPHPNGVYVMGVDPAFGRNDETDRHAIEVFRCYADKLVQVAEYATPYPETYQVSWVMCHLAGAYGNVFINYEISGPGFAVQQELRHLKQLFASGAFNNQPTPLSLEVFNAVRFYLYSKPDSIFEKPSAYGWRTTQDNKLLIMNQLRDTYSLKQMRIRSIPLLEEMARVVQNGSEIKGEGRAKDDRVFASALAVKAWMDRIRAGMIAENRSHDAESEKDRLAAEQPQSTMIGRIVQDFFKEAENHRDQVAERAAWQGIDL